MGNLEIAFGAILALSWSSSGALVRRLGRLMWLLELSWDLPMPLLAPTCTLTSQLGVNSGLNLPPKLIFPSIAVLPNLQNHQFSLGKPWFLQGGAVCCPIALGLLFRSSWTSLGRLWSPTWSVLGASWRVLGSSGRQLRSLGALLAALGTLLAALGTLLAALGTLLGRSWDTLGTLLVALGCSWGTLGRSLAPLGRSRAALGTTRKNQSKIDAKNDRFGRPKALQNDAKIEPKSDPKSINKTKRKRTERSCK